MFAFIIRKLKALNVEYYVLDGCIYVTKGKAEVYPCVVAHMDTVHNIVEDLTLLKVGDNITGFNTITMKQTGVGGDDKVGIYLALELLMKFDNMKAVFFRDEEVGCHGSYDAYMEFFDDCSFVLQGDRRGNNDFITRASGIQLSSKNFRKAVSASLKKYGYSTADGMMTDVMALKENGLKISCANISCGYYNPHSSYEYVNVKDVQKCLNLMTDIIRLHGSTRFPHTVEKLMWKRYNDFDYDYKKDFSAKDEVWKGFKPFEGDEGVDYFDNTPAINHCDWCQQSRPLTYTSEYNAYLCSDCATYLEVRKDV
jgi:putative aminopeptidase FrvX